MVSITSFIRFIGILIMLVSAGLFFWSGGENDGTSAPTFVDASNVPVTQTIKKLVTKNIEDIRIGERALGVNPEGAETSEDSEIFNKVKHDGYTLLYLKENQTLSVIELLRPENWLDGENVQIRHVAEDRILTEDELAQIEAARGFDGNPEDYDLEVWIELPEMGVVGWSTLVGINEKVDIKDGPGNVVTGTFAHISDSVIDLQIAGQDKPIGCTANHPFWSEDRQEFVEAGELLEGERVLLYSGETKRIAQKLPRPGPQVVYNLEVFSEHVYHVTDDGVLVHNTCGNKINQVGQMGERGANITKNTHSITIKEKNRIPDALDNVSLTEVKNVKYQHLSRQLRDYLEYSKSQKIIFNLIVRKSTKLSRPLQDLIDKGEIQLIRKLLHYNVT